MNELFAKIANSNASLKEDVFRDGQGVVEIRELICKSFFQGPTFVARTKVVSSASKGDVDPVTKQPIAPNAAGSKVGWPQMLQKHASAPGNVKGFILALLGFKESDVSPAQFTEAFERLISKDQPARGMLLGYQTYQQATRSGPNAGKTNTYVKWTHVAPSAGNSPEEIAKRRAELDKTDPVIG